MQLVKCTHRSRSVSNVNVSFSLVVMIFFLFVVMIFFLFAVMIRFPFFEYSLTLRRGIKLYGFLQWLFASRDTIFERKRGKQMLVLVVRNVLDVREVFTDRRIGKESIVCSFLPKSCLFGNGSWCDLSWCMDFNGRNYLHFATMLFPGIKLDFRSTHCAIIGNIPGMDWNKN